MSNIYMYHCRGALRLHEVRDPVDYQSSDGFNIEFACHVTQCDMLRISTAMSFQLVLVKVSLQVFKHTHTHTSQTNVIHILGGAEHVYMYIYIYLYVFNIDLYIYIYSNKK